MILNPPQSLNTLALYPCTRLFHLQFLIICSSQKQTGLLLYDLCVTQLMSQLLDTMVIFEVSQVPVEREVPPTTQEANEPYENVHVTAEECVSLGDPSERCLLVWIP